MIITDSRLKADTKTSDSYTFIFENFADKFYTKDGKVHKKDSVAFISYKHGENDYVYRLNYLLKQNGFEGYIDYEDDSLPIATSGETAKKLKKAIKHSNKFILIASNAAINSKWCNWELGIADVHKYINHLALFCIKPDGVEYQGTEYLQIYPSIQVKDNFHYTAGNYYVQYPDGSEIGISEWLKL